MSWRPEPRRQNAAVATAVEQHARGALAAQHVVEAVRGGADTGKLLHELMRVLDAYGLRSAGLAEFAGEIEKRLR